MKVTQKRLEEYIANRRKSVAIANEIMGDVPDARMVLNHITLEIDSLEQAFTPDDEPSVKPPPVGNVPTEDLSLDDDDLLG